MLISILPWLIGGLLVAAAAVVLGFMLATSWIATKAER
ncbi:MAG: alpha/beta hydrolase, partial [Mesorhizobium sp.]